MIVQLGLTCCHHTSTTKLMVFRKVYATDTDFHNQLKTYPHFLSPH
jgi:hypothetical protein